SVLDIGTAAVQGFVHVFGSSTVYWKSIVSAFTRVKSSTMCIFAPPPGQQLNELSMTFASKFVVSTTSVLPSQWARESPSHWRIHDQRRPRQRFPAVEPEGVVSARVARAGGIVGGAGRQFIAFCPLLRRQNRFFPDSRGALQGRCCGIVPGPLQVWIAPGCTR